MSAAALAVLASFIAATDYRPRPPLPKLDVIPRRTVVMVASVYLRRTVGLCEQLVWRFER